MPSEVRWQEGTRGGGPCALGSSPIALSRRHAAPGSAVPGIRQAPVPGLAASGEPIERVCWELGDKTLRRVTVPSQLSWEPLRTRVHVSGLCRPESGRPSPGSLADGGGPWRRGPESILRLNSLLESSRHVSGTDARGPELPGSRALPPGPGDRASLPGLGASVSLHLRLRSGKHQASAHPAPCGLDAKPATAPSSAASRLQTQDSPLHPRFR